MDQLAPNKKRGIKVEMTLEEIEYMVSYAMINGYRRKHPTHAWDIGEQNRAVKWALMHMLAIEKLK